MRFAIFGDIHGNLEALETVLADCGDVDEYICLGDTVGYGANPEQCIERVREIGALCLAGNHDHAAVGRVDISFFNQNAREAVLWTEQHLSADSREWILGLSFVEHLESFTCVHGSLQAPEMFNYISTVMDAEFNFRMMDKPVCFCGHSHLPLAFFDTAPMTYTLDNIIPLEANVKTIVNVGSVGQPRDENPRASYAVYDSEENEVEVRRIEYDIETAAQKIMDAGLPPALALRLSLGR